MERRRSISRNSSQRSHEEAIIWDEDKQKFQDGSIMCIKLKDFMTFEKITISPSSGLNLIIGPNGSGKSTIVCAIGLGLASSPSILARTSKISGFIRHGCTEATIKILLKGPRSFWICRRIKDDNQSVWRIKNENDTRWTNSTAQEVMKKVASLHIQLDNLCMFLPQERVKEFSTLKPPQLLTATEQAINPEVYETHQNLLKDFSKLNDMTTKIGDLTENYNKYTTAIDQMKGDVMRYRQVEECKKSIETYKKAIPWAEYQRAKADHAQCKNELKDASKQFEQIAQSLKPLADQVKKFEQEAAENEQKYVRAVKKLDQAKRELLEKSNDRFQIQANIKTITAKINEMEKSNGNLEREIEEKTKQIENIEEKAKEAENIEELRAQKSELNTKIQEIRRNVAEVNSQIEPIRAKNYQKRNKLKDIEGKIKQLENQKQRLLDHIGNYLNRRDIVQVYQYVEKNRNTFTGKVFGPIAAEMKFNDPEGANIIQMVVETHFLLAFLIENEEDRNSIENYLKQHNLARVTLLRASDNYRQSQRSSQHQMQGPPDISQYGFEKYANDLFTAPDEVKEMLNKVAQLDRVPIGKGQAARASVDRLAKEVFPQNNITRYITDDIIYYAKKSKYSAESSVLSLKIRKSNIWSEFSRGAEDVKILKEKRERTKAKIDKLTDDEKKIRDQIKEKENEKGELSKQIMDIVEKIRNIDSIKQKIQQMKMRRDQLIRDQKDLPGRIQQMKKKLEDTNRKRGENEDKIVSLLVVFRVELIIPYDKYRFSKDSIQSSLEDARNRLQYERSSYSALEKNIRDLSDRLEQKKRICKELKAKAEANCRREDVELQLDLDNLNDQLSRLEARLNQLAIIDPSIQKRYSDAEKKAQETKKELDALTSQHEAMNQDLSERFTRWKQSMSKEVDKMNAAFRNLMETCGYRGEVHIAYDDEAKLDTYKLNLMVAFNRQSTLSILSSTRQSGGEKSVTTLMFLLALQDCTQFPFRVVDEINQGMDEVNDRNSFVQVMSYAMRKNQSSQYFLVTPKLLPNLEQMDGITVMVVMNGPYVSSDLNKPVTFESGAPEQAAEE